MRPPFDKQILTILKSEPNPASWDPGSKSWKLSATPDNAVALDAKLVDVFSRVTNLKVAQGVAQDFTALETHPLIVVTAKGHNIIVAMPDDNNAGQALNRAGFSWQPALKAYAGVPDDEDQAERMSAAIAAAGRHLDRAILPHTPERDGIPHLNSFSVKVLHDAQENTAQRYAAEPNVRRFVDKIVDRYNAFSDEQKAAVQFKDAKAFGDITGVDHAKAGIAMNIVEAALRVQDQGRSLVQQKSQALAQTQTLAPSQSM